MPDINGHTIFCDDIRYEIGNKHSLIGIYKHSLIVHSQFPFSLNKFAFAVMIQGKPSSMSAYPIKLKIILPGSKEESIDADFQIPEDAVDVDDQGEEMTTRVEMHLMMGDLKLSGEGRIRVRAIRNGEEIKLGSLQVVHAASTRQPATNLSS